VIDLGDELSDWDDDGEYHPPVDGARWAIEDVFAMRDAQWSTVPVPAPYGGSRVPLNALQKAGFNRTPPPSYRAYKSIQKIADVFDAIPHLSSDEDYAAIRARVDQIAGEEILRMIDTPKDGFGLHADKLGPHHITHWIDDEPQDV